LGPNSGADAAAPCVLAVTINAARKNIQFDANDIRPSNIHSGAGQHHVRATNLVIIAISLRTRKRLRGA
jgi:hypothetical protein